MPQEEVWKGIGQFLHLLDQLRQAAYPRGVYSSSELGICIAFSTATSIGLVVTTGGTPEQPTSMDLRAIGDAPVEPATPDLITSLLNFYKETYDFGLFCRLEKWPASLHKKQRASPKINRVHHAIVFLSLYALGNQGNVKKEGRYSEGLTQTTRL